MPVYDFECSGCGKVVEHIISIKQMERGGFECEDCGEPLKRIITASGQYCANEDADWLKTIPTVVDKEGGPAAREFVKNPTRSNYKAWMKEAGVRHLEPGEGPVKPKETMTHEQRVDYIMRKHQERMTDSEYRRRSEKILREGHHNYRR